MVRITAYIKPHRLEQVKSAVAALGVTGLNVADVRGTGNSPEKSGSLGGGVTALPIRSRLSVVVADDMREEVAACIVKNAQSGEPGDGKVFVEKVLESIRVRTGERGDAGL